MTVANEKAALKAEDLGQTTPSNVEDATHRVSESDLNMLLEYSLSEDHLDQESELGKMVHRHIPTLHAMTTEIRAIRKHLGENLLEGEAPRKVIFEQKLKKPITELHKYLTDENLKLIPQKVAAKLKQHRERIKAAKDHFEYRKESRGIIDSIDNSKQKKPFFGLVRNAAGRIEKLVCLYELFQTELRLEKLNYESKVVRERHRMEEEFELVEISFDSIVEQAITSIEKLAHAREIKLKKYLFATNAEVCVVPDKLRMAIEGMLQNAIKYTKRMDEKWGKSWIKIETDRPNRTKVRLRIESWGVPIFEDELTSVLEEKKRGRAAVEGGYGGTGYGLAFAKEVAEEVHGSVTIESELSNRNGDKKKGPYTTTQSLILPTNQ